VAEKRQGVVMTSMRGWETRLRSIKWVLVVVRGSEEGVVMVFAVSYVDS